MRSSPGLNVYSTLPTSSGSAYGYYSGTSMATLHVAGVAALLKSQQPTLDDAQLKTRILDGVDAKGTLSGRVLTGGRLNAANALPASSAADRATDTTDPTVTQVSPSRTRDRTPRIAATVSGDRAKLAQGDKTLTLDGRDRTGAIAYDAGADRLVYDSARLSTGQHRVEITATDEAGNTTTATKTFRIVRR